MKWIIVTIISYKLYGLGKYSYIGEITWYRPIYNAKVFDSYSNAKRVAQRISLRVYIIPSFLRYPSLFLKYLKSILWNVNLK